MFSILFFTLGVLGLLLIAAGYFYIKKFGTASAVIDPIALIIAMTYKYVIGATVALLVIGFLFKYIGW